MATFLSIVPPNGIEVRHKPLVLRHNEKAEVGCFIDQVKPSRMLKVKLLIGRREVSGKLSTTVHSDGTDSVVYRSNVLITRLEL